MKDFRPTRVLAAAALAAGLAAAGAEAQTISVASYGGAWGEALSKAELQPIAKEMGITIKEITVSSMNEIKLQVEAGAVEIDVADMAGQDCVFGAAQGLFEPLDYSIIVNADGVDPSLVREHWIGGPSYYSTVLAWNTEAFGDNPPQSWADFWDVEKFPGTRALYNNPFSMVEIALMADGVPLDQIYPPDLDRAFAKLREIKPHIDVWWTNGGQSAQLLADGEIDMLPIWNGRVSAVMKDGAPANFTFNQGLLGVDCLLVPRGTKNKELAMKVIDRILSPELQANLPQYIDYGPVNAKAFETGKISEADAKAINSAPGNRAVQVTANDDWWGEHLPEVQAMWDKFLQE
jgi:putative spermidine/putrescine transport system substrate-binding protein